jgi:hypothetical protein
MATTHRRWKLPCFLTKLYHYLQSNLLSLVYYDIVSLSQAPCLRNLTTNPPLHPPATSCSATEAQRGRGGGQQQPARLMATWREVIMEREWIEEVPGAQLDALGQQPSPSYAIGRAGSTSLLTTACIQSTAALLLFHGRLKVSCTGLGRTRPRALMDSARKSLLQDAK